MAVQLAPGDAPAGVSGELTEESPLRPAIALAERVDGVDLPVVVRESRHERVARQPHERSLRGEVREDSGRVRLDERPSAEHVLRGAGDVDRSQLPGPGIDGAEDLPVEAPQMTEIIGAGQWMDCQAQHRGEAQVSLGLTQRDAGGDAESVEENAVGVDVGVFADHAARWYASSIASICPAVMRPFAKRPASSVATDDGSSPSARSEPTASSTARSRSPRSSSYTRTGTSTPTALRWAPRNTESADPRLNPASRSGSCLRASATPSTSCRVMGQWYKKMYIFARRAWPHLCRWPHPRLRRWRYDDVAAYRAGS